MFLFQISFELAPHRWSLTFQLPATVQRHGWFDFYIGCDFHTNMLHNLTCCIPRRSQCGRFACGTEPEQSLYRYSQRTEAFAMLLITMWNPHWLKCYRSLFFPELKRVCMWMAQLNFESKTWNRSVYYRAERCVIFIAQLTFCGGVYTSTSQDVIWSHSITSNMQETEGPVIMPTHSLRSRVGQHFYGFNSDILHQC